MNLKFRIFQSRSIDLEEVCQQVAAFAAQFDDSQLVSITQDSASLVVWYKEHESERSKDSPLWVEAEGFVLKDREGNRRAFLGLAETEAGEGGTLLTLCDAQARQRFTIAVATRHCSLTLHDPIQGPGQEAKLSLGVVDGNAGIWLQDSRGITRACLTIAPAGTSLRMSDASGSPRLALEESIDGPTIRVCQDDGGWKTIALG